MKLAGTWEIGNKTCFFYKYEQELPLLRIKRAAIELAKYI
jgi:hypothetical protein